MYCGLGSQSCGLFPGLCPVGFTEPGIGLRWAGGRVGVWGTHILKGGTVCLPTVRLRRNWKLNFLSFNREGKIFARSSCNFSQWDTIYQCSQGNFKSSEGKKKKEWRGHSTSPVNSCDTKCFVSCHIGGSQAVKASTDAYPVRATVGCWQCTHRRVVRSPLALKKKERKTERKREALVDWGQIKWSKQKAKKNWPVGLQMSRQLVASCGSRHW